jgi:hypothetical protein
MTHRTVTTAVVIAAALWGCAGPENESARTATPAERAQTAGQRANRDVVGQRTEAENERRARTPPPPKGQAGEPVGQTTTTAAETAARDVTRAMEKPGPYEPYAIELNPLGLIVGGRVSLSLEWVPVTHHGLIVSPHFVHTTADIATGPGTFQSQSFTGVGGEIGYRYYSGTRGPIGIFVGPSLIFGVYNAGLPNGNQAFTDVGLAVDGGVQTILLDHLVLGAGAGLEYLKVSHDFGDLPMGPSTIASTGLKPRILASAGYGF